MTLGDRMKDYERLSATRLMPKVPVLLRIDGKAFHTLTKDLGKPWDFEFVQLMQNTTKSLCENIQGCVLGYVQSDEISLLLTDWRKFASTGYFDYKIQKLVSVVASMATAYFNANMVWENKLGVFDCRAWNLPLHEINNYFTWRQQDASRNSVQMLARNHFSHKECHGKNNSQLQDMLMTKGVNWNDTAIDLKRGACVRKVPGGFLVNEDRSLREVFSIDRSIPIFTQDPDYINCVLPDMFEDEK